MKNTAESQSVYSAPTMCLHCHLIVVMKHAGDADPLKGAWECPKCGHKYPFAHWKIKKRERQKRG